MKETTDKNDHSNSEARLRSVMESIADYALISMDKSGIVEEWNKGAEVIFGFKQEEIIGKSGDIIFTDEDRKLGRPDEERIEAITDGRALDERWHQRRDGSKVYMSGVLAPILSPEHTGFVKVARDMTQQKLAEEILRVSEERYRIALQAAEMAAWDWDIVNDGVMWNEQHYHMLGLTPTQDVLTMSFIEQFIHPDDLISYETALRDAISQIGLYHSEFRIIRQNDQATRWMRGYGRVINYDDQGATRMVGVMYDITEQKNLEQQKEEFLGIASHELKTPVTSIKGYGELLEDTFDQNADKESSKLISKMNIQVTRLNNLIGDLLDTSRIYEGQLNLKFENFNLITLIEEVVEEMQSLTKIHTIILECRDSVFVTADMERIRQVLSNLISNGIKYSPKGGNINITCKKEQRYIRVTVNDQGVGIPKALQQKVFNRFFRVQYSGVNQYSGMGLGLYITAGIISKHHGEMGVDSIEGQGSSFYFTLPTNEKR